jgi:hypothetical protein
MFKHILKNLWTTIAGAVAGLPTIIAGIKAHDTNTILLGTGVLLTGLLSKDGHK